MNAVFADTSYYVGLLNPNDQLHERATKWAASIRGEVWTTDFVLVEVANFFSRGILRVAYQRLVENIRTSAGVTVVEASRDLWDSGYTLFVGRADKEWSLTDCISIQVMKQRGLTDALTADVHFAQAGLRPLLLTDPA